VSRSRTASIAGRNGVAAIVAAIVAACGSNSSSSGVGAPCTRTSDCQSGLSCGADGVCTVPDAGAPLREAGGVDAGALDGRSAD
jgi:hypothetical protein